MARTSVRWPGATPGPATRSGMRIDGVEEVLAVVEVEIVLAEALPVVGGDHDQGAVADGRAVERLEHLPDLGVHRGDLAVVLRDVPAEALPRDRPRLRDPAVKAVHRAQGRAARRGFVEERRVPGRGRLVGRVRVHVVQPEQERAVGLRLAEVADPVPGDRARAVHLRGERLLLPRLAVAVEAPRVPERGGDVGVVDGGHRLVPRVLQDAGQRRVPPEEEGVALAVAGLRREAAGHDPDEAAAGLGPVGVGLLEDGAAPGEGVHPRARRPAVPVRAHVVGAQRVDRDEQNAHPIARRRRAGGRRRLRALRLLPRAARQRGGRHRESQEKARAPQATSSITMTLTSSPAWSRRTRSGALQGTSRRRSAHSTASTPPGPGSSSSPSSRSSPSPRSR